MGYFELTKRRDGGALLNLKANNGMTILTLEDCTDAKACQTKINAVKNSAARDVNYEINTTPDRKFYFNLKTDSGEVVAKSVIYVTKAAAGRGIDAVKKNAPEAHLVE